MFLKFQKIIYRYLFVPNMWWVGQVPRYLHTYWYGRYRTYLSLSKRIILIAAIPTLVWNRIKNTGTVPRYLPTGSTGQLRKVDRLPYLPAQRIDTKNEEILQKKDTHRHKLTEIHEAYKRQIQKENERHLDDLKVTEADIGENGNCFELGSFSLMDYKYRYGTEPMVWQVPQVRIPVNVGRYLRYPP